MKNLQIALTAFYFLYGAFVVGRKYDYTQRVRKIHLRVFSYILCFFLAPILNLYFSALHNPTVKAWQWIDKKTMIEGWFLYFTRGRDKFLHEKSIFFVENIENLMAFINAQKVSQPYFKALFVNKLVSFYKQEYPILFEKACKAIEQLNRK